MGFSKVLVLGFALTQLATAASFKVDDSKLKGSVEFLAIGKPSALKIRGKAAEGETPLKTDLTVHDKEVKGKATFKLDAFDTGMALRNKHMKEKYLETAKHPTAELNITKLTLPSDPAAGKVTLSGVPFTADLKLHGVTKKIEGKVDGEASAEKFKGDFAFTVKLTDFEIAVPSFMGVTVAEDVKVDAKLEAPLTKP